MALNKEPSPRPTADAVLIGIPRLPGALCVDHPEGPDLWFTSERQREAKAICRRCPALVACRAFGDEAESDLPYVVGVWGGESARERLARRQRDAQAV